jgi:GNAT superfamily N-acetyltransferase
MAELRELGPQETHLAYAAMLELRPHLGSLEEVVRQVNEQQRPEGYRLVASFEDGVADAAAFAGFRTAHSLAWGYYLYIDDLSTCAAYRKRGHGALLMQWVAEEARRLGCAQLHLDSGVHRYDAHRLYLNQRMDITAHHFGRGLEKSS